MIFIKWRVEYLSISNLLRSIFHALIVVYLLTTDWSHMTVQFPMCTNLSIQVKEFKMSMVRKTTRKDSLSVCVCRALIRVIFVWRLRPVMHYKTVLKNVSCNLDFTHMNSLHFVQVTLAELIDLLVSKQLEPIVMIQDLSSRPNWRHPRQHACTSFIQSI